MEAIKLCRLDTPIIFIEARINLSRFVVTGCAAKTSATVTFPSLNLISLFADRKSGSAGMPRPISYAVFCLKKKNHRNDRPGLRRLRSDSGRRLRRGAECLSPRYSASLDDLSL